MRIGVWSVALALAFVLACQAGAARAGARPSPETCEQLGSLVIKCFDCKAGKYLGKVAVLTDWDETWKRCYDHSTIVEACTSTYDVSQYVLGYKGAYTIGLHDYDVSSYHTHLGQSCLNLD